MRRFWPFPVLALAATACLAPPPRIVVETPYGDVRAGTRETALEVAEMLETLAPEVQAILPGCQDRPIDIWVQDELRVYRFRRRPETVRGFTLLRGEFAAKRIHLQQDGQSPWYLAHELVHALIGPSWSSLPGILEEGLGDVVAEKLNRQYRGHIRAHRLLNASAFTNGLELEVAYREPLDGVPVLEWPERRRRVVLRTSRAVEPGVLDELFAASRSELQEGWPEIPESFYGIAWLIVSRIVERQGLEGLHQMCLDATAAGHEVVPREWLLRAAAIDPDELDETFLRASFGSRELVTAVYLQPDAFGRAALAALEPLRGRLDVDELRVLSRPSFVLWGDDEQIDMVRLQPIMEHLERSWRGTPVRTPLAAR